MKAIVVCGSPRAKGNTQMILETACDVLKENGVDAELVLLHNKFIKPCIACEKCKQLKDRTCSIKDDDFHPVLGAESFLFFCCFFRTGRQDSGDRDYNEKSAPRFRYTHTFHLLLRYPCDAQSDTSSNFDYSK